MILVTFNLHEKRTVEQHESTKTVADLARLKGIGANEKIYINGSPVEDRTKTIGDIAQGATSISFNVITKTNNA